MASEVGANDVGVGVEIAETGTLWVVVTVEATETGAHVQVLPLADIEAPTSLLLLLCRVSLGRAASATTIWLCPYIYSIEILLMFKIILTNTQISF